MEIDGKPHTHSFYRDSDEVRVVEAVTREGQGSSIRSKIEKLLVLKSTGSQFWGFHRDGMLSSGMDVGVREGYAKLDRLIADGSV